MHKGAPQEGTQASFHFKFMTLMDIGSRILLSKRYYCLTILLQQGFKLPPSVLITCIYSFTSRSNIYETLLKEKYEGIN